MSKTDLKTWAHLKGQGRVEVYEMIFVRNNWVFFFVKIIAAIILFNYDL